MEPRHALRNSSLELFVNARDFREYEVAYHALCCVLHAAESLQDPATCVLVERLAEECGEAIDSLVGHKLSSQSAAKRGHESLFKQLAVMAGSARLRMKGDAVARKRKGRPEAPLDSKV